MTLKVLNSRLLITVAVAALLASGCGGPEARKQKSLEASQAFLEENNLEKARVELRNVLQIDPNDAEARYLSGVVAERLQNVRQAAGHYRGALDVAENHAEARAALARIYVVAGLPAEAIKILAESPEPIESSADLLAVRGAARAQLGLLDDALSDAEAAVAASPANERALALYAGVLARIERTTDAANVLEDGIAALPESVDLRIARAVMAEDAGEPEIAERLYKEVVDIQPESAMYAYQLSGFYERQERYDVAEQSLRDAATRVEDPRSVRARLVTFLETRVGAAAAEKELLRMKSDNTLEREASLMLAAHYQRNNRLDLARAELEALAATDPRGPDGETARSRLAVLLIRQGDRDTAVRLLEETLEANPRAFEALQARAGLSLAENRPDDAIVDLRVMLRDQPESAAIHQSLAQAHLLKGDTALAEESFRNAVQGEPENLDARIRLAQFLAQTNKYEQAIDLVRTVVVSEPGNISARETAFRISASAQRWDDALSWADSILDLDESNALARYLRGIAHEGRGEVDVALEEYAAALDLQPVFTEALAAWSRILVRKNDLDPVIEKVNAALAVDPDNAALGNLKGEVLLNAGSIDEARQAISHVIETTPGWWLPYRTMARSYVRTAPEDAVAVLQDGIQRSNAPVNLAIELATLYEQLEQFEDAISVYENLIESNRQSDLIANNLAMLLANYRSDDDSLQTAGELTRTFSTSLNPAYLNTFGWVRLKSGELQTALPVLERAAELSPDSAIMQYHLGIAHLESGDREQARVHLAKALELQEEFPGAEEARQVLDDIQSAPAAQKS